MPASYDCAHFSVECVIIALIYIERLLDNSEAKVLTSTWRPIVLAAIIVAQARTAAAPRTAPRPPLHRGPLASARPRSPHPHPQPSPACPTLASPRRSLRCSQKVFDDNSLTNVDFSTYCPMFSLREINFLENKFLELLSYNVSVSAST